jgi:hypothetical protein
VSRFVSVHVVNISQTSLALGSVEIGQYSVWIGWAGMATEKLHTCNSAQDTHSTSLAVALDG